MAAFDLYAACNALAARYAAVTAPTGEAGIRAGYGQDPNDIAMVPTVVIFPVDGELIYEGGDKRGEYHVDAKLYLSKAAADYKRLETSRQKWLVPLLGATDGQLQLGLASSGVQKAIPTSWEFAQLVYGSDTYDGIVIHLTIFTIETVTLVP